MKIINEVRISDNGFVFNSNTGDSFNVNTTGLELTKLIAQGFSFDEIKNIFLQKYELDDLTFEKDFYEFCALIKQHQLTVTEDPLEFK